MSSTAADGDLKVAGDSEGAASGPGSAAAAVVAAAANVPGVGIGPLAGPATGPANRSRRATGTPLDGIIQAALRDERDAVTKDSERYTNHFLFYAKMNFDGNDSKSIAEIYRKLEADKTIAECTPLIIRSNSNTSSPQVVGETITSVPPSLWVYGYDASGINFTLEKLRLNDKERKELDELHYQDDIQAIKMGTIAYYKFDMDLNDNTEQKIIDEFTRKISQRIAEGKSKYCYCIMGKNEEIWIFGHQSSVLGPTLRKLEKGERCYRYFKGEIADHFQDGEYGGEGIDGQGDMYSIESKDSIATLLHKQTRLLKIIPPHELDEYSYVSIEPNPGGAVEARSYEYSLGMRTQGIFAITRRNPAVEGVLWSHITRTTLNEFSLTYRLPGALPYFILIGGGFGFLGFGLGYKALISPEILWKTTGSGPGYRLLFGIRDGVIVFIGLSIVTIAAYLSKYPNESYVSNETFWTKIALGPLFGGLAVTVLRAISPLTKSRYLGRYAEIIFESISDVLVTQAMWSSFFLNTCERSLEDSAIYGVAAGVANVVAKGIVSCLKPSYHSTPYTVSLYLFFTNAIYDVLRTFFSNPKIKRSAAEYGDGEAYVNMMLLQTLLLAIQVLAGSFLTWRSRARFIQNFRGEPVDIISRIAIEHPLGAIEHLRSDEDETTIELIRDFDVYVSIEKECSKDADISKLVEENGRNKIVIVLRDRKYLACFFNGGEWLKESTTALAIPLINPSEADKTKMELKFIDVHQLVSQVQGTSVGKTVFPGVGSSSPNAKPVTITRENALFLGRFIRSALTLAKLHVPLDSVVTSSDDGSVELALHREGSPGAGDDADDRKSRADSAFAPPAAAGTPLLPAYGQSRSAAVAAHDSSAVLRFALPALGAATTPVAPSGSAAGRAGEYRKL